MGDEAPHEDIEFLMERLLDEEEKGRATQAQLMTACRDVQERDNIIMTLRDEVAHLKRSIQISFSHEDTFVESFANQTEVRPLAEKLVALEKQHRAMIQSVGLLENQIDVLKLQLCNTNTAAKAKIGQLAQRTKARIIHKVMKRIRSEIVSVKTATLLTEIAQSPIKSDMFAKSFVALRAAFRTVLLRDVDHKGGLEWIPASDVRRCLVNMSSADCNLVARHLPTFVVVFELHREIILQQHSHILEEVIANEHVLTHAAQMLFQSHGMEEIEYLGPPECLLEHLSAAATRSAASTAASESASLPRRQSSPLVVRPGGPGGPGRPGGPGGGGVSSPAVHTAPSSSSSRGRQTSTLKAPRVHSPSPRPPPSAEPIISPNIRTVAPIPRRVGSPGGKTTTTITTTAPTPRTRSPQMRVVSSPAIPIPPPPPQKIAPQRPLPKQDDCFLSAAEIQAIKASSYGYHVPSRFNDPYEDDFSRSGLHRMLSSLSDDEESDQQSLPSPPHIHPPQYSGSELKPVGSLLKCQDSSKKEGRSRVQFQEAAVNVDQT